MRFFYSLLVPGGLLVLAVFTVVAAGWFTDSWPAFARIYPYVVFAAGILLGCVFNRSRVVLALLVLAAADVALHWFAAGDRAGSDTARLVTQCVALLLPLNLAVLASLQERGLLTGMGLLRLGALLAQAAVVAWLGRTDAAGMAERLERGFIAPQFTRWTMLSQLALLAFVAALVFLGARFILRRRVLDKGFLWALAAAYLALNTTAFGPVATIYFATAGLVLTVSIIEASHAMAYRDELTGLPGRRALNEALLKLGSQYAVAMADVDHFKKFNDTYGHKVGDQVLRMVAAKLAQASGGARAFRYGGEEFSLLFPGKTVEEALPHLESLRAGIEASSFTVRGAGRPRKKPKTPRTGSKKTVSVTVSMGVAGPDARCHTPAEVIQAADQALYRAKEAGRNQVKSLEGD